MRRVRVCHACWVSCHAVEHGERCRASRRATAAFPADPSRNRGHPPCRANGISRAWPRKVCDAPSVDARCFGAWGHAARVPPDGNGRGERRNRPPSPRRVWASPPRATKATLVPERALMSSRGDGPGRLAHLPSATRADAQTHECTGPRLAAGCQQQPTRLRLRAETPHTRRTLSCRCSHVIGEQATRTRSAPVAQSGLSIHSRVMRRTW